MDSSEANGSLANEKAPETVGVGRYVEMEQDGDTSTVKSRLSGLLWHGGSAYDAWFSCASNQVTTLLSLLFPCSCSSEASESSYA
jgi:auxin influx carrier (AUX1 LAX family)